MSRYLSPIWQVLMLLALFGIAVVFVVGCAIILVKAGLPYGVPLVVLGVMIVLSAVYAYLRYQHGRQEEFLQLLTSVTDGRLPLSAAVRSYLRDRPDSFQVQLVLALLLTPILCGFVFVWYWLWTRRFDAKLGEFAGLIEEGWPLPDALREVRGLTSRETRLAADIGLATGRLGVCLHRADRERLTTRWLELVPRVLYPLAVLFFVTIVTAFLMELVVPKFRYIFSEFGTKFPTVTERLVNTWDVVGQLIPLGVLGLLGTVVLIAVLIVSSRVRWFCPVIGRWYRWDIRGEILRLLGVMLDAKMTVPDALHLLADAEDFPGVVHARLDRALAAVEQGEPLADALSRNGLLSPHMVPLVAAAERAGTLPWALTELGEHLGGKALRAARRVSLVVGPVLLILVAAAVGFIALAIFLPLVHLITIVGT